MAAAVGSLIGIVSGYYGGNIDFYVMRLMDILSSVPSFLLAIIVEVALGWGKAIFDMRLRLLQFHPSLGSFAHQSWAL